MKIRPIAKLATLLPVLAVLLLLVAPQAQAQICPHYFCHNDYDCWMFCPSANWAICNSQNVCDYGFYNTSPDPNANCPTAFCSDNQDCLDACPAATDAVCDSNNSCRY